jgi:BirA family transcriptional regulator, biotin operon repressor / biotin---[acetyl-CoA-carboxylase] ligase
MMDSVLPPHEIRALPTRRLGRRVLVFPRLESSNSLALSLATDPAQHGLVLLAGEQSAGRGQYGRGWEAPPGSSVLMSLLLFPPPALRRPALLVAWAAVSVCELVRAATGSQASIKWPNDVLVRDRKVCGILIEQRNSGDRDSPLATVVGVGLNVTQPAEAFAAAGLPCAGSLFSTSGKLLDVTELASRLIAQLDEEYDRLLQGDFTTLEARWRERLGLIGCQVCVEGVSQMARGRLLDVSLDGLALELANGETIRLAPEAVRHINEAGSLAG